MPLKLDISALEKAIASLEAALARANAAPEDDVPRDACIQRFEYTYELSHKMLRRFLSAASANPAEIETLPFPSLIRLGSDKGLLAGEWPQWKAYRNARSITIHTYDERKAKDVFALIPAFLEEARGLRDRLASALS